MYNLHVISVQFVLAMFLLDAVVELRSMAGAGWAASLAVFLGRRCQVLVWKLTGTPVDFSVRPEVVRNDCARHSFNPLLSLPPFAYIWSDAQRLQRLALFVVSRHGQAAHTTAPARVSVLSPRA
jgi:hypothetical protein